MTAVWEWVFYGISFMNPFALQSQRIKTYKFGLCEEKLYLKRKYLNL
jgi:hypothetical protein